MTERGNPENLRAAAQRKHDHAVARAERALHALVRDSEPVNFRAVARLADCSPDFLYRTPVLRARIQQLRAQPRRAAEPADLIPAAPSTSMVIRELAAQLADEKQRHRDDVAELEAALAAAHGELLQLRRGVARPAGQRPG
jgi:phage shock protein A